MIGLLDNHPNHAIMQKDCDCGYSQIADTRGHKAWHVPFERGIACNETEDGTITVTADKPGLMARVAYKLACTAMRAGGYDFPSFPFPHRLMRYDTGWTKYHHTAYLAIRDAHAVGYLSVIWVKKWATCRINGDMLTAISHHEGPEKPVVNLIFVCNSWRRRGVAKGLINSLLADAECDPKDLIFSLPLTNVGFALAKSFRDDGLILVG